jgi:hypothetical protein
MYYLFWNVKDLLRSLWLARYHAPKLRFLAILADFVCFWWKWVDFEFVPCVIKKYFIQKIKYFYSQVFCTCWMQYIMFWFWEIGYSVCYSHGKSQVHLMYVGNLNFLDGMVACILFINSWCMHFKKKFEISWSGLGVIVFWVGHVCLCVMRCANFGWNFGNWVDLDGNFYYIIIIS